MPQTGSFRDFLKLGSQQSAELGHQGSDYFDFHVQRLYNTYLACVDAGAEGKRLISFGAGSAYIENALACWHGTKITLIEFPETIQRLGPFYDRLGFEVISGDITETMSHLAGRFDVALSSEVVEHIPRPPAEHIRLLSETVGVAGSVIVTTPNFGNIRVVGRLLMLRPVMPAPERTFGPICFENEGIHRREYLPSEMIAAFEAARVRHVRTTFTENAADRRWAMRLATSCLPRFRSTMILQGRKEAA